MWSFDDIFCESKQVAFHCFCAKTGHFAELRYLKEITDCYIYITLLNGIYFSFAELQTGEGKLVKTARSSESL